LFAFLLFCIVFKVQCSSARHHTSRASLFILSPAQRIVNAFFELFAGFFESFWFSELNPQKRKRPFRFWAGTAALFVCNHSGVLGPMLRHICSAAADSMSSTSVYSVGAASDAGRISSMRAQARDT